MRRLNANEKRLLILFAAAIFIVVNLFLFDLIGRLNRGMKTELANLKNERIEAQAWLEEAPIWQQRREWLDANQPSAPLDGTANSALLQDLQRSASALGITIIEQSLPEPVESPHYKEVSVKLRIGGTLEQIARWLAELQAPDKFQAVTSFNIRSDKEPPKVLCDLQVARWYKP